MASYFSLWFRATVGLTYFSLRNARSLESFIRQSRSQIRISSGSICGSSSSKDICSSSMHFCQTLPGNGTMEKEKSRLRNCVTVIIFCEAMFFIQYLKRQEFSSLRSKDPLQFVGEQTKTQSLGQTHGSDFIVGFVSEWGSRGIQPIKMLTHVFTKDWVSLKVWMSFCAVKHVFLFLIFFHFR